MGEGVLNEAMRESIPEEWITRTITPIYKQKGDPLECNNFGCIIPLSHRRTGQHPFGGADRVLPEWIQWGGGG